MTPDTKNTPIYSICMCNYNMADTLDVALRSILEQIAATFEVVIVDDGSSDKSVEVIKALQKEYQSLRLIELERDPKRKLGLTRNISVQEARGDYILLHLDCDDVTAPFINDFAQVFHQIEKCRDTDFLLSGRPIQMGKKSFLLQHGPYRNIHRGEDRDLWSRLASIEACIPLDHKSLKTRLPKSKLELIYRAVYYTYDHLRNDFRKEKSLFKFLYFELTRLERFSWKMRILRLAVTVPAWVKAMYEGPLPDAKMVAPHEGFGQYRIEHEKTFTEILQSHGRNPDWSSLSPEAKSIFE